MNNFYTEARRWKCYLNNTALYATEALTRTQKCVTNETAPDMIKDNQNESMLTRNLYEISKGGSTSLKVN